MKIKDLITKTTKLSGPRNYINKLWNIILPAMQHKAYNTIHLPPHTKEALTFLYQALLCPSKDTLQHAISSKFLTSWPLLNTIPIHQIPFSPAHIQGHLDQKPSSSKPSIIPAPTSDTAYILTSHIDTVVIVTTLPNIFLN